LKFCRSKLTLLTLVVAVMSVMLLDAGCHNAGPKQEVKVAGALDADLAGFSAVAPIDAHAHVYDDAPAFASMLKRLNLRVLNICVIDDRDPFFKGLEPQRGDVLKVRKSTHGRAAFCTTFNPYGFEEPGFKEEAIRQLNHDFTNGAVAVKIYKVMGMEIKNKAGRYVMPDDPAFEPVYKDITAHNRTVVAHLAEPDSCWQPPNPSSPDYGYYKQHPQEYAYLHPEWPSKAAILAARDHLLAENPNLRVVGAHLGSMETDVDQIARRFDHYPNFAADTAARVQYLMMQPREKVRAFLIKYQDRVLYGTDLDLMPDANAKATLQRWQEAYLRDWRYFATDQWVTYHGKKYQGLKLPDQVVHKIFHDNAIHWFPGILAG
jgi:predicted TIM-barrel fold metal-dependent hydrolase/DNA-directed RNA polymerase subunit H (RpoH/RPB5)